MRLLIPLLALLLSSCWMGRDIYTPKDARQALAPGIYSMTDPDGKVHEVRVSILGDGMTSISEDGDEDVSGFAPLDNEGRKFVHWMNIAGAEPKDPNQFYQLAERRPDQSVIIYAPSCEAAEAEVARAAGAAIERGMAATCRFQNRASLEDAMRHFQPKTGSAITFVPRHPDFG